jgi:hypothetical protein
MSPHHRMRFVDPPGCGYALCSLTTDHLQTSWAVLKPVFGDLDLKEPPGPCGCIARCTLCVLRDVDMLGTQDSKEIDFLLNKSLDYFFILLFTSVRLIVLTYSHNYVFQDIYIDTLGYTATTDDPIMRYNTIFVSSWY